MTEKGDEATSTVNVLINRVTYHRSEVKVEVRKEFLQRLLKKMEAETEVGHAGFVEISKSVVLHQTNKHTKCIFLRHLSRDGGGVT